MYHNFFIHSSGDGLLRCFLVLAIVNSTAMNTGIHVSLSVLVSSGYRPDRPVFYKNTPVFLLGKLHGQGSLVGYGPCGHKESHTTDQ